MFIIAGCIYLLALLVFHLLAPRLEPAQLDVASPDSESGVIA
jgi:hypothetical protein